MLKEEKVFLVFEFMFLSLQVDLVIKRFIYKILVLNVTKM